MPTPTTISRDVPPKKKGTFKLLINRVGKTQTTETTPPSQDAYLARLTASAYGFVDRMSHEFRTPLTVVKGHAAVLRDNLVGETSLKQRGLLDVIDDRVNDLTTMVDDMLDNAMVAMMNIRSHYLRKWVTPRALAISHL